jgi:hypothetical protein
VKYKYLNLQLHTILQVKQYKSIRKGCLLQCLFRAWWVATSRLCTQWQYSYCWKISAQSLWPSNINDMFLGEFPPPPTHTHTHTCAPTHTCAHTRTRAHTHTHSRAHARTRTGMRAHAHTCTHAHAHAHTHTHTHKHTKKETNKGKKISSSRRDLVSYFTAYSFS